MSIFIKLFEEDEDEDEGNECGFNGVFKINLFCQLITSKWSNPYNVPIYRPQRELFTVTMPSLGSPLE